MNRVRKANLEELIFEIQNLRSKQAEFAKGISRSKFLKFKTYALI